MDSQDIRTHVRRFAGQAEKREAVEPRHGHRHSRHRPVPCGPGLPHRFRPFHGQGPSLCEGRGPAGHHRPPAQRDHPEDRRGPWPRRGPGRRPGGRGTARGASPKPEAAGAEPEARRGGAGPAGRRGDGPAARIGLGHPFPVLEIPAVDRHSRQVRSDHPAGPPGHPAGASGRRRRRPSPRFLEIQPRAPTAAGSADTEREAAATGQAGGGGAASGSGCPFPLKGYDLLPWATAVIDRLQLNWALPAVPEVPDAAKISMIVVIKKTGELDSIEILEGTSLEALDRAALEAIRASLPFPRSSRRLPRRPPRDHLRVRLQ